MGTIFQPSWYLSVQFFWGLDFPLVNVMLNHYHRSKQIEINHSNPQKYMGHRIIDMLGIFLPIISHHVGQIVTVLHPHSRFRGQIYHYIDYNN